MFALLAVGKHTQWPITLSYPLCFGPSSTVYDFTVGRGRMDRAYVRLAPGKDFHLVVNNMLLYYAPYLRPAPREGHSCHGNRFVRKMCAYRFLQVSVIIPTPIRFENAERIADFCCQQHQLLSPSVSLGLANFSPQFTAFSLSIVLSLFQFLGMGNRFFFSYFRSGNCELFTLKN